MGETVLGRAETKILAIVFVSSNAKSGFLYEILEMICFNLLYYF